MNRGKWSQAGVPHRGWSCEYIEDLGTPSQVCEMCESQEIRYVHYMSHPEMESMLACGCECAGHMEQNRARAESRDKAMKNAARRRSKFPDLKSWGYSMNGNHTLKKDGKRVTVFDGKKGGYKFVVNFPHESKGKFSRKEYDTLREAKLAVFDAMVWYEENLH